MKKIILLGLCFQLYCFVPIIAQTGSVLDIDGNAYRTVKIGNQIWMAENLRTSRYRDGDSIPEISDRKAWENTQSGASSHYQNNQSEFGEKYGKLYNWHAVSTGKLCPKGWHVPGDEEWQALERHIGMSEDLIATVGARGWDQQWDGKLKSADKGAWHTDRDYYSNETGFTALPAGYRTHTGTFQFIRQFGHWWTSSADNEAMAWKRHLSYYRDIINRNTMLKNAGLCVRCVKDES
ncbi:fibrobacter succinogenes major paralogous domain-containing protein [Pararhodonellum marinum]|uniref:fibrobacter succinogenes major paralogous domain-containing protein n=1 Tax=Pararhodonellum marinum TaxID=2755358 RepID=UPI00188F1D0D|nr:fibrobacter succinogenes major paralogous domain-containing protein [Pararhodonellum marinum]